MLGSADQARRLVLSLFFRAVLGVERIFHFETLDDPGFAILTGGKKVMSRSRLGGLVRAVTTAAVDNFARATERLSALRDQVVTLSVDEHVIARFTRKFKIPKGFHTIRNKKMRAEKLSYLYWPKTRRFLSLVVARGNAKLVDLTIDFIRALRRRGRLRKLRVILDAGGSTSNDALCRLDRFRKTVFLIRAPRRPGYVDRWKKLPPDRFTHHTEPGRFKGAKDKEIEIAETTTAITGVPHPLRTIVVRERALKGKDRWHALFILHDDTSAPLDLLHEYRTRQHHEQGHRIGVHDLWIDTTASGYPKSSRPDRPGFRRGPFALHAWIAALAWDALRALGDALPPRFHLAHPRTLRRWALLRDADLILTPTHLLVVLTFSARRAWLRPLVQRFNKAEIALPWLDGRRVAMGFAVRSQALPDAQPVLAHMPAVGSGRAAGCGGRLVLVRMLVEETSFDMRRFIAQTVSCALPQFSFVRTRAFTLRSVGVRIGSRSGIFGPIAITGQGDVRELFSVGDDTLISGPLHVDLAAPVRIGSRVQLGHHVVLLTVNHEIGPSSARCGSWVAAPIHIGDGVWIASRVTVLPGVSIGDGSVAATGAVVSRDVAPNTLVAGVPARLVRVLDDGDLPRNQWQHGGGNGG